MGLKNVILSLTTASQTVYTCPGGIETAVYGIVISNNTDSLANFTMNYFKSSSQILTTLASSLSVAGRTEYTWPRAINCTGGDYITISANTSSALILQTSMYER